MSAASFVDSCPILGKRLACRHCGALVRYVQMGRVYWFRCQGCARSVPPGSGTRNCGSPSDLSCRNCDQHPYAHQDGRCLFGPAKYIPHALDGLMLLRGT